MQIHDYIEVIDVITHKILLKGKIQTITKNPMGYSVDNIVFVNPNSNKIRIKKIVENNEEIIVEKQFITDNYILIPHNNIDNYFEYDFFVWNEIEPEVKTIVELLNKIEGIHTYSSCSGHGIIPPWVDFYVTDWDSFFTLLDFLQESGYPSKTAKHNDISTEHRFIIGVEGKGTVHLESLTINSNFECLCKEIRKFIRYNSLIA